MRGAPGLAGLAVLEFRDRRLISLAIFVVCRHAFSARFPIFFKHVHPEAHLAGFAAPAVRLRLDGLAGHRAAAARRPRGRQRHHQQRGEAATGRPKRPAREPPPPTHAVYGGGVPRPRAGKKRAYCAPGKQPGSARARLCCFFLLGRCTLDYRGKL